MSIDFNHTIVHVTDRDAAAREVAETLGLAAPASYGPFAVLELDNGASLDFMQDTGDFATQHYAFLVDEESFDRIHERIRDRGQAWWADPFHRRPGEINTNDGGRGLYWEGPDGHNLEIITRPYGSGS
jgi:catechol 2,3-dioxygenase-like lactoylglutathione lyase family enzyme